MMSTMSMSAASSLNPDAPMFIPAAFRRVEDYSPEWYELVKTTAWFRDHWFRQQQLYEDLAEESVDDVAALLPDDSVDLLDADDLFYSPPSPQQHQADLYHYKPAGTHSISSSSSSSNYSASQLRTQLTRPGCSELQGSVATWTPCSEPSASARPGAASPARRRQPGRRGTSRSRRSTSAPGPAAPDAPSTSLARAKRPAASAAV
jgi:hypothetical protein